MAGCGACGGCCAHCGATCGACGGGSFGGFGGGSFGGLGVGSFGAFGGVPFMGGMRSFGFSPFFGGHHASKHDDDDDATPVDADALVDPTHPGHREAIATISHVDDEKHEKITQWIKEELHRVEHGGEPKQ